jgi:uncharacterized protein (DUF1330 family)
MAAYVLLDIDVVDPAGYEAYKAPASRSIEPFGGRFLVRGGEVEMLEGSARPHRIVLVEFPSVEVAKRWYASEAYRSCAPIRERTAKSTVFLIDGI